MSRNFIGGEWRPALSGGTLASVDPSTGRAYGAIADSGAEDVDVAVKAARRAFDDGAWGRTTAVDRGRMLTRLSGLILDHAAELSQHRGPRYRQASERGDGGRRGAGPLLRVLWRRRRQVARRNHSLPERLSGGCCASRTASPATSCRGTIRRRCSGARSRRRWRWATPSCSSRRKMRATRRCASGSRRRSRISGRRGQYRDGKGPVAGAALAAHPGVDFLSFTGSPVVGQQVAASWPRIISSRARWSSAASRRRSSSRMPTSRRRCR